ncbi:MMPL family transporter [Lactiplantibacillus herbarum]|uniref:MMPL family transporter n=1 Tax=Lactiplantibacillus herbarum TaxID=1670446 RepID=UPI000ABAEAE7
MVAAIIFLPNVSNLVRDKGQTQLPSSAKSQVAKVIQNHWGRNQNNTRQVVVVFNNGDSALTSDQKQAIDGTIKHFKNNKSKYYIKSMTAASDSSEAKAQLISKDKSTELLQLMVGEHQTVANMTKDITAGAKTSGVKTYITGSDILNDDFTQETEAGIQKTEIITVIFIFIVLTLVFRSPIAPLVSLLSVGVSFIISLSVVMNLVDKFNFPLSNHTQVFMVVVLFGIGTDYNILMFDQFKEELSHGDSPVAATGRALRVAGRTILYSGSSLLIGFSALGLANFSIYKSAVGVAIAVAILLLVLLTLNPFFMALLGPRLFWPSKKFSGGSTSKMWHGISSASVRYPIIALVVVLGVSLPFVLTYNSELNYDTLAELGDTVPAKQGFQVVQDHFSKGTAEPSTLYIKTDHALNNEKDLKVIDSLTKQLQKVDGVKTVASVTQPGGSSVDQLYVKDQLKTVTSGMKSSSKGLTKISSGLDSANSKLKSANLSGSVSSAKELADGADQVASGLSTLNGKTGTLSSGASQLASGSSSLASGVVSYTNGVYTVNKGLSTLNSKTGTLSSGVAQLFSGTQSLSNGLDTLNSNKSTIASGTNSLTSSTAELQSGSKQVSDGLTELETQIKSGSSSVSASQLKELVAGLNTINSKMQTLVDGSSKLESGMATLNKAAETTKNAQSAVTSDMTTIQSALESAAKSDAAKTSSTTTSVDANTVASAAMAAAGSSATSEQKAAISSAVTSAVDAQNSANAKTSTATTSATSSTSGAQSGLTALADLQKQLTAMSSATAELQDLSNQLSDLSSVGTLASASISANKQSIEAVQGLQSALTQMQTLETAVGKLSDGSNQVTSGLSQLQSGTTVLASKLNQYTSGVSTLATGANTINNGMSSLSSQVPTLTTAISALSTGTSTLNSKSSELNSGAAQLASGTASLNAQVPTLVSGVSKLNSGASQVATGNEEMYTSIQSLVTQMKTLQDGLTSASDGVKTINKGTGTVNTYLTGLKDSAAADTYYVPKSTLKGSTYKTALKAYMSGNNHATKMTIVLSENPSSKSAMNKVAAIQKQATNSLKGTSLDGATIAIGGQTSETNDTQSIASSDFVRTAAIMLVGILIALMVITRSVLQPFYIIGTLLLAYIMSLSITRMLSSWILGESMLTWNTPFFGFIMLIALGVDYSIFLMMKYREFDNSAATPSTRIVRAAGVIGAVVLSAALILSGTFAALMPSGVLTLIQVAMVVIIGLIILVFAIPTIIPSLIRLTYPLTDRMENESTADDQTKRSHK